MIFGILFKSGDFTEVHEVISVNVDDNEYVFFTPQGEVKYPRTDIKYIQDITEVMS